MNWYKAKNSNDTQGLVIDEKTGANIAVTYDPKHSELIAAAPELADALEAMTENYINEVKEWGEANGEAVDLEMLPGVAEARAALKKAGR